MNLPPSGRILALGILAILCLAPAGAFPQTADRSACSDEPCAIDRARELLAKGQPDEARAFLKDRLGALPESGPIRILIAVSYAAAGNHAWAVRTLADWIQGHPEDCEARTWLAWEYVRLGSSELAREALPDGACSRPGPAATRADMLRALLAPEGSGREAIARARRGAEAWESDRAALPGLSGIVDPDRPPDLSWGIEAAGGYTTDARLGSPSDPGAADSGDVGSGLLQSNVWIRGLPDVGAFVRPAVEFQVRMLRFFDADASGLSYLNLTGRAGVLVGRTSPRVLVGYRPDFLLLAQGDRFDAGPVWYVSGHRGELELEIPGGMLVTAGAGHRRFRELGRTRWEVDASVAGQVASRRLVRFLWAVSGRGQFARDAAYDLGGLTVLANLTARLPGRWTTAATATVFADWYPRSAGFFASDARSDLTIRPGVVAWSPPLAGATVGAGYEFSKRLSSAPSYAFTDHRFLLKVRWGGSADLVLPLRSTTTPAADLPWGLSGEGPGAEERVQDLLRQDEQVQNVCGCGG